MPGLCRCGAWQGLSDAYTPLCFLDLAAVQLLILESRRRAPGAPSVHDGAPGPSTNSTDSADEASRARAKRQRVEPLTGNLATPAVPLPAWLTDLLDFEDAATLPAAAAGSAVPAPAPVPAPSAWLQPPSDGAAWSRRLLVLAAIVRRLGTSLPPSVTRAAVEHILPMARRTVHADAELEVHWP